MESPPPSRQTVQLLNSSHDQDVFPNISAKPPCLQLKPACPGPALQSTRNKPAPSSSPSSLPQWLLGPLRTVPSPNSACPTLAACAPGRASGLLLPLLAAFPQVWGFKSRGLPQGGLPDAEGRDPRTPEPSFLPPGFGGFPLWLLLQQDQKQPGPEAPLSHPPRGDQQPQARTLRNRTGDGGIS